MPVQKMSRNIRALKSLKTESKKHSNGGSQARSPLSIPIDNSSRNVAQELNTDMIGIVTARQNLNTWNDDQQHRRESSGEDDLAVLVF